MRPLASSLVGLCVAAFAAVLSACGDDEPPLQLEPAQPDRVLLESSLAVAEIHRDPYRLRLINRGNGAVIASEIESGGEFYERDGMQHALTTVR